ncbi:MAG TPA: hypothetical protein VIV55_10090 [Flavobacterium sp.]
MAFADLQPNQMVDENNASTGGFSAIGAKNPANQCYTKAQALAAYSLDASLMSAYTNNQLVPKSVWNSGIITGTLNLEVIDFNLVAGISLDWATARLVGTTTGDLKTQALGVDKSNFDSTYQAWRSFFSFNSSQVTNANVARFNATIFNSRNNLSKWALQKTNVEFPSNHAWANSDFASVNGQPLISNILDLNFGSHPTGSSVSFDLNAAGLAYLNSSSNFSFCVIQIDNDYNNVAPAQNSQLFISFRPVESCNVFFNKV